MRFMSDDSVPLLPYVANQMLCENKYYIQKLELYFNCSSWYIINAYLNNMFLLRYTPRISILCINILYVCVSGLII